jgi:hypothetical protein
VEEDETAYKKPLLSSSSFFIRFSEVSGVTRKIKSGHVFL